MDGWLATAKEKVVTRSLALPHRLGQFDNVSFNNAASANWQLVTEIELQVGVSLPDIDRTDSQSLARNDHAWGGTSEPSVSNKTSIFIFK